MQRTAWLCFFLVGCGPIEKEKDYINARAAAECRQLERCALGFFESEYRDRDDCEGEVADDIEDYNDAQDDNGCDYIPEEAGHCVHRVRSMSCEEWGEGEVGSACDLVWNCNQ